MLQIIYVSSANPLMGAIDRQALLKESRKRNRQTRVTGFLYSDGTRFMQVIEGPDAAVEATMDRIRADPRHCNIVTLIRRPISKREFSSWSMAHYGAETDGKIFAGRVGRRIARSSVNVRSAVRGFVDARRALLA